MKNSMNLLSVLLLSITFPLLLSAQADNGYEFKHEVHRTYPFPTIQKENLDNAEKLIDLNMHYEETWVRSYNSVVISATVNGRKQRLLSSDDRITEEQMEMMQNADVGEEIEVEVQYIPENDLPYNEVKEFYFSFIVDPVKQASFDGGLEGMEAYFDEIGINDLPKSSVDEYNLLAVKFTVNEEGQVSNVKMHDSSKDAQLDSYLISAICNMPTWTPAQYANGKKVKQDFVFIIGDMRSCTANVLFMDNL